MANLHVILATTLDGFVAGSDGSLDWIIMGDERADYMIEAQRNADTLLMGRKSYQGYASYWPAAASDPNASAVDRAIGANFNAMRKVVFSTTLEVADWEGTSVSRSIERDEIERLKEESVTGVHLDSSISVVQRLTSLGLVDEYRLMVHPVALGSGRPLFTEKVLLELYSTEHLRNRVVVLTYRPAG